MFSRICASGVQDGPPRARLNLFKGILALLFFGIVLTIYIEVPLLANEGLTGGSVGVTLFLHDNLIVEITLFALSLHLYVGLKAGVDRETYRRLVWRALLISQVVLALNSVLVAVLGAPMLITGLYWVWFFFIILVFYTFIMALG